MKWLSRINPPSEEANPIIYLSPEALQHVYVMPAAEFENFQNSSKFEPGGRLMEVSRQYSYTVRKVADLREEAVTYWNRKEGKQQEKQTSPVGDTTDIAHEPLNCSVG